LHASPAATLKHLSNKGVLANREGDGPISPSHAVPTWVVDNQLTIDEEFGTIIGPSPELVGSFRFDFNLARPDCIEVVAEGPPRPMAASATIIHLRHVPAVLWSSAGRRALDIMKLTVLAELIDGLKDSIGFWDEPAKPIANCLALGRCFATIEG